MPSSSCVCFHNLLMRPSFKLDWRCSDFDPTHRDVTRLFKWNEGRSVCFSMLRLSWWPTSNASNANRRRVQVGWGTSGCERSNRSLAKLSIEISLTRKRVKGGQKRDILRSESILVELTGAPIEKRMLRPVLLLRYKPMIVLSWTTVSVEICVTLLLMNKPLMLLLQWTLLRCSRSKSGTTEGGFANSHVMQQTISNVWVVWCEPYFAKCIS